MHERRIEFALRPATVRDADTLALLFGDDTTTRAKWQARLEIGSGPDHFLLIACEPDDGVRSPIPAGYVSGGGARGQELKGYAEIYELLVAPNRRRRGAGRALVQGADRIARDASYAGLVLRPRRPLGPELAAFLAAVGFARHLGDGDLFVADFD